MTVQPDSDLRGDLERLKLTFAFNNGYVSPMMLNPVGLSLSITAMLFISGCSSFSPEVQESLQDVRGSLPKFLRGAAVPLEEQPMPTLSGQWSDKDFPTLNLSLIQSGDKLTIRRTGERYGIKVVERIRASLTGRAIEASFINEDPNQIRPTRGSCIGSVTLDSQTIRFTCSYGGRTFPLNFVKQG